MLYDITEYCCIGLQDLATSIQLMAVTVTVFLLLSVLPLILIRLLKLQMCCRASSAVAFSVVFAPLGNPIAIF